MIPICYFSLCLLAWRPTKVDNEEGAVIEKDTPPNCEWWMVKSHFVQMHPVEEEWVQHSNDQLPVDDDGGVSSDADLSSDAD